MKVLSIGLAIAITAVSFAQKGPTVVMPASDSLVGVTYASVPGAVYLPIDELSEELGLIADWDTKAKSYVVGDQSFKGKDVRNLFDGTPMINVLALKGEGVEVEYDEVQKEITIQSGTHFGVITIGEQWVEVNLKAQRLRAYQGDRLVMETKISSGKKGSPTITGEFTAGPEKSKYRTSSLYNDAPMPFAVQVHGNYFIHGSSSVPNFPASHGCVRMPLTGQNAAKYFFEWVELGAPVSLRYGWSERVAELDRSSD